MLTRFAVESDFHPTGDQPKAIEEITDGFRSGLKHQTLMGVTGSGKTFTMACAIEAIQKPTLVLAHNKTLAAQLATEFKEFFPDNAVEYFVSYYNYYQPEAYVPRTDTYIEKDADVNEELDKLRHAATRSLLTRKDVLIVASVSCIFGLGSPEEYQGFVAGINKGEIKNRNSLIRQLIDMQYERNDYDLTRGKFRVRGDTLDILPAYEERGIRIEFWGDEVERILQVNTLTGEILSEKEQIEIYPNKHFVTSHERLSLAIKSIREELKNHLKVLRSKNKILEAQRLESRTQYDLEMLEMAGYCAGVENYSRHLSQRQAGSTPYTLLDYFPNDFLLFIDESHITLPQVRGMYFSDRSRKETLVEHGFRLPSALDNRPLDFDEFNRHMHQTVYVSATPNDYELSKSERIVEQIIRPTGLKDPIISVKPTKSQIDDLIHEITECIIREERCIVTTLTKRMSEELSDYLKESGIKTHYLHSEIDTLERSTVIRDLRLGVYDVIVGINLLREGLDLPEVSLVAILDADKEGYLRSSTSLIQTIGRAARHVNGKVIMYADVITKSMKTAIDETTRRREIQEHHNLQHGISPQSIQKTVHDITERITELSETVIGFPTEVEGIAQDDIKYIITDLKDQMRMASDNLDFEKAATIRDQINDLQKVMSE